MQQESENLSSAALSEIFKCLSQSVREIARSTASLAWAEMTAVDCILRADWLSAGETLALLKGPSFPPSEGPKEPPRVKPEAVSLPGATSHSQSAAPAPIAPASAAPLANTAPKEGVPVTPVPSTYPASVNLELFKKFVECTRAKSEVLATKLKFVKMNAFNEKSIEFTDTPENATYLSFNQQDSAFFWEAQAKCQSQGSLFPQNPCLIQII